MRVVERLKAAGAREGISASQIAERYIAQLQAAKVYRAQIVTTLEEAPFYAAEAYHQDFLERNPTHPYIAYNDLPKVRDLASVFPNLYRAEPALVMARPRARSSSPAR